MNSDTEVRFFSLSRLELLLEKKKSRKGCVWLGWKSVSFPGIAAGRPGCGKGGARGRSGHRKGYWGLGHRYSRIFLVGRFGSL